MIKTFEHHQGEVREVRLDRPPANALSPELIAALGRAVEEAPRDGARALVLSGAPGLFSAGLDVPLLLTLDRPALAEAWHGLYSLLRGLAASPIPVAAALTGHCPAGGTVLALFCDRRFVAAGDWKMGLNEVRVGLPLPPVILQALRRQVGPREAERLAVGGLLLSPADAVAAGLADELVPAGAVVERAIEWCRSLTALPPTAMSLTRREARADLVSLFDRAFEEELPRVAETWWSAEAQGVLRGLVAKLAEKRKG
jgi:3,2-trans-enoyl-CoA isomerase